MQKWEYKIIKIDVYANQKELNEFGKEGWELVALLPAKYKGTLQGAIGELELEPDPLMAYFKRPN
jgi:Domain of unknown function (DUF4177)